MTVESLYVILKEPEKLRSYLDLDFFPDSWLYEKSLFGEHFVL